MQKNLCLGFKQICASIFAQLCLGFSDQPHAVLDHIYQTSIGSDGQPVTATIIEYYQCMLNAACPFVTQACYAISICDCFIRGLNKTLLTSFRKMYPNHSTVHDLSGSYQHCMLPVILVAAQAAKDKCKQFQVPRYCTQYAHQPGILCIHCWIPHQKLPIDKRLF